MIDLRPLNADLVASGSNQPDRVIALIMACLGEDMTDGPTIVRTISALGYNGRFVGIQLRANAGLNPDRNLWQRLNDGTYKLH
jgi:predicted TIM-barrel fold metal-dependent hydrolase